ncbi:sugar transferase [Pokkaliibacter sp. CJK22405]|uniref:sugar transferase n=1 Tax=Pokkaliibacter sp. CJK22405 TaxID=3384615 RepID=UPI003984849F
MDKLVLTSSLTAQNNKRSNQQLRGKIELSIRELEKRLSGRTWGVSATKRYLDALVAGTALLALSPVLLIIALLIKLTSRGPVFFVQQRTGYRGRRFGMFKFRTMVVNAEELKAQLRHLNHHGPDSVDFKIKRDPRITWIGRWLRGTSLDELPNLINVLRGDMRLVGPRPTSFDARTYLDHHLDRLNAYPGITGLWQISGRSNIDFDERVQLDRRYILQQSFWLDLKILLKTPIKVISGDGAG